MPPFSRPALFFFFWCVGHALTHSPHCVARVHGRVGRRTVVAPVAAQIFRDVGRANRIRELTFNLLAIVIGCVVLTAIPASLVSSRGLLMLTRHCERVVCLNRELYADAVCRARIAALNSPRTVLGNFIPAHVSRALSLTFACLHAPAVHSLARTQHAGKRDGGPGGGEAP